MNKKNNKNITAHPYNHDNHIIPAQTEIQRMVDFSDRGKHRSKSSRNKPLQKNVIKMVYLSICLLLSLILLSGCGRSDKTQQKTETVSVSIATVQEQTVGEYTDYVGNITAVSTVDIRARVEGFLIERAFTEGQNVQEGQLLFKIDPRSFIASRDQALAEYERALADLEFYNIELARMEILVVEGAISREEYDKVVEQQRQAKANVMGNKAKLDNAELDLGYTTMVSPINGHIGETYVNVGNLVGGAQQTKLATVVTRDPVYACFSPAENDLPTILHHLLLQGDLPVSVTVPSAPKQHFSGKLDFINNTVDPLTSTILLRAVVDNPEGLLIPGMYVQVRLLLDPKAKALVVPQAAVIGGQGFDYVYIVDEKQQAQERKVTTGKIVGKEQVIESGLKAGEKVITAGLQKVSAGVSVSTADKAND